MGGGDRRAASSSVTRLAPLVRACVSSGMRPPLRMLGTVVKYDVPARDQGAEAVALPYADPSDRPSFGGMSVAASTLPAVNTDDLAWQAGNYGGLSPRKVDFLLEHGHLDLVIRAAEERGEWFCAERAAQELCRLGEFVRALKVMEPFVATGWRTALWAKADILLRAGRTDEALDLVRPDKEGRTSQTVCRHFAELLAKAGCVDEAIDLLVPHLGESWIRTVLVEITEGQEHDERVLDLIAPHAEAARRARDEGRWDYSCSDAQELQARVLERGPRRRSDPDPRPGHNRESLPHSEHPHCLRRTAGPSRSAGRVARAGHRTGRTHRPASLCSRFARPRPGGGSRDCDA